MWICYLLPCISIFLSQVVAQTDAGKGLQSISYFLLFVDVSEYRRFKLVFHFNSERDTDILPIENKYVDRS